MQTPHPVTSPEWLIVGHGALASLWAHHLAATNQPATLITRANPTPGARSLHVFQNQKGAKIEHRGGSLQQLALTIDTLKGHTETRQFRTCNWNNVSGRINQHSRILIMVKAWQLQSVIEQLAAAITQANHLPAAIIISHNGIGAAEALLNEKLQEGWPIFDLVTTHGAWRKHAQHVVHAGAGESVLGPRQLPASNTCMAPPSWFDELSDALPPLTWDPDILVRRWHKLAINCAINPLATLAQQPNGVLAHARYQADIHAICAEIAGVAAHVLGPNRLDANALEKQVHQVIHATANNTCSMLQDVNNRNPTEIDYLNGYVAKLAQQLGLSAPVNQRLAQAISQL